MAKNELREKPVIVVVKKRGGGHGHHGGAWKVAFADFMTALMAMFLVLWIVGQSSDVKAAIAGYFQDPLGRAEHFGSAIIPGVGAARPPLTTPLSIQEMMDVRVDVLGRLATRIQEQIVQTPELAGLKDKIDIQLTDNGLRIELLEDTSSVFFESGSAVPQERGRLLLRAVGRELSKVPNHVVLEGHTDARPFTRRSRYSNWELSTGRANTARRLLIDGGLRGAQVDEVRGLADRQLRVPQDPFAAENRRVSITVSLGMDIFDVAPSTPVGAPTDSSAAATANPAQPSGERE